MKTTLWASAVTGSLLCSVALGAGCSGKPRATALPPQEAQKLLLDRNWLDRLPETAHDRLHVFRFVPAMGGGVYQDRTLFAGQFELFTFDQDGQTIRFHLHHTGEERGVAYTIDRVPEDSALELHLHLADSPRGPSDYYSPRALHGGASEKDLEQPLQALWSKVSTR